MSSPKGPIAWMANNSVAANLVMFLIFVGGILGLSSIKQEIFPSFDLDLVQVQVPYPGASPAEVEQGIVLAIEEAVRGVDGVKRVNGTASEDLGSVAVELLIDSKPDKVLADIKSAVDRITSFPEEAEEPVVKLASHRSRVVSLIVSGDLDQRPLHELVEEARAFILESPDVTQVEIGGLPPREVSIEVPRAQLEAHGLSLEQVALAVRAASLELPAGAVETHSGDVLVRLSDRRRDAKSFGTIVVAASTQGGQVLLEDIATITDGYADTKQATLYNGQPAVTVTAYRVGKETPIRVSKAVAAAKERLEQRWPDTVSLAIWDDDSVLLRERIDLLMRNARLGLVLVLLTLALFLDLRLAFWVGMGIPISFLGTFFLMPAMGSSINMISLFALIITLGMVVDDAIVVGEAAFTHMQEGMDKLDAAIAGAKEMAVPVSFSILTSIAAFAPMLAVPGTMGKIFRLIPIVVISVLTLSWMESFFILPAHLSHSRAGESERGWMLKVRRVQERANAWLQEMTQRRYVPLLRKVLVNRWLTVSVGLALLLTTVGLVRGGVVPFSFMPKIEGDVVMAQARLPYGVPLETTQSVAEVMAQAANTVIAEMGVEDEIIGTLTRVGEGLEVRGPGAQGAETGTQILSMEIQLVTSGERSFKAVELRSAWREAMPDIAGLKALTFSSSIGPGAGSAVAVQLSHHDSKVLEEHSEEITEILRSYKELRNVENGFAAGKPQIDYHLLPAARSLNLTGNDVARQVRSAFYGAEALREQQGRDEVKVMVRLPLEERSSEGDLEALRVRTPAGSWVPLGELVRPVRSRAATSILREDGRRVVTVRADMAAGIQSSSDVLKSLKEDVFPKLREEHPDLSIELVGSQREQSESFSSLGKNFIFALFAIFALLAIPFRSYLQPVVVMTAIPFGFVGAVFGHFIMGYSMSLVSMMGIIALSGVVVNDSLVLVDTANRYRNAGASPLEAIMRAGPRRLRPIMLTSLTTFFGLAPMIFETSVQARFLIPMALSLGFGILFATGITLVLVPVFYLTVEELRNRRAQPRSEADGELEASPADVPLPG